MKKETPPVARSDFDYLEGRTNSLDKRIDDLFRVIENHKHESKGMSFTDKLLVIIVFSIPFLAYLIVSIAWMVLE